MPHSLPEGAQTCPRCKGALCAKPGQHETSEEIHVVERIYCRRHSLLVFLDHPTVPLDNNHSEQALRDLVLGRNNHQGSRSEKGTGVAALFYSLIESAERCGVNPAAYLRIAARQALKDPKAVVLPFALPTDDELARAAAKSA